MAGDRAMYDGQADENEGLKEVSSIAGVAFEALHGVSHAVMTPYEALSVQTFAPNWFADCRFEIDRTVPSTDREHVSSIRREVIFAVCLAESYLFEWVRDEVCGRNFEEVQAYFPIGAKRGGYDKWNDIPKQLARNGRIPHSPDFGGPHGTEWQRLLDYRDGLIHASVSRPKAAVDEKEPSYHTLRGVRRGWALAVVIERIKRLHDATHTALPEWLKPT
jgi:hypothetical protein